MPQPIDIHTELARVDTTTRVQQVADRAALAAQQRNTLEAEERRAVAETNVHEKEEIDSDHLDPEYRRRSQYGARRKRRKPDKDTEPSDEDRMALRNPDEGGNLDISV